MGMQQPQKLQTFQPSIEGAGSPAKAQERASQGLSRRQILRQAIGGTLALVGSGVISGCALPNQSGQVGSLVDVGPKSQFKPALPHEAMLDEQGVFYSAQAKAYIVHLAATTQFLLAGASLSHQLDEESWVKDSDESYWLALYQRCTHLGCKVPFRDDCHSFKCPCHGSHYHIDGEYVDGPAPRSLDRFPLSFQNDHVMIDTNNINAAVERPNDQNRLIPVDGTECFA